MAENEEKQKEEKDDKKTADEKVEKKKSPLKLIIIVVAAGLIVGGAGTVAYLALKAKGPPASENPEEIQPEKVVKPESLGPIVMLDTFIVNLAGAGGRNYLKFEIGVELSAAEMEEELNNKMPQLRDAFLMLISSKTYEEVATTEGKLVLKDELLIRLNSFMTSGFVKNIYFTSFIIQ